MDSNSFQNIKRAVDERSFKDEKLDALRSTLSCSYGYLSADQVAQLVSEFSFDDDREKVVEICAPRMYSITCEQAASIMRVFSFDKSKIKVLEVIVRHITDNNLSALDSALNFSRDRDRAREILMSRSHSGLQPGFPAGGFPGMAPQPGGYPAPAPYPGQASYGQPGPVPPHMDYPGGALSAMGTMMNATAGAAGAMMKGMGDMFGPQGPQNPPQGGFYQPPGAYYPPPGGFP